jgi:hypothetical protein
LTGQTSLSVCPTTVTICNPATPQSWTSAGQIAAGIVALRLSITEKKDNYQYTLVAVPALSSSTLGVLGSPTSGPSCGFALPGTGTYASTLCFVGFTNSIISSAEGAGKCASGLRGVDMSVAVPGGYTMSFCLTVSLGNAGDSIVASDFPSWPGAFLGNDINGTPFYTGVGCPSNTPVTTVVGGTVQGTPSCIAPSIYQTTSGATDTVTLSGIVVDAPQGIDATGYAVVTADAETTDPSESITWTSSLPAGAPFVFSQIPDSPSSPEGDACNMTNSTGATGQAVTNGSGLTGINTTAVQCTSTWQSSGTYPRTGTVLLDVSPTTTNFVTAPVTISAVMHGAGLEGIAIGLLLP